MKRILFLSEIQHKPIILTKKIINNEFKPITNRNFTFTKPSNLTYDGTAQKAPLECNIEDIKDKITLSYYNKDDGQKSNEAINAGTYTVTANIAGNPFYRSGLDFHD